MGAGTKRRGCTAPSDSAAQCQAQRVSFRGMLGQEGEEGNRPPSAVAEDGLIEAVCVGKSDIVGYQQPSPAQQPIAFRHSVQVGRLFDVQEDEVECALDPGQVREGIAANDLRPILEAGAFQVLARTRGESRIELWPGPFLSTALDVRISSC